MKLVFTVLIVASITEVKADLIGFNRLGNNVQNFYRFRDSQNIDYQLTNYQSIMENTTLTMGQKKQLLNFLGQETPVQKRGKKRYQEPLENYVRKPFLNRKKTEPLTGKRVTRSIRLNAYKSRMNQKIQI